MFLLVLSVNCYIFSFFFINNNWKKKEVIQKFINHNDANSC